MESLIALPSRTNDVLTLASGYRAFVSPITPASKPLIAAAMSRLSLESSRRRFFTPRRACPSASSMP